MSVRRVRHVYGRERESAVRRPQRRAQQSNAWRAGLLMNMAKSRKRTKPAIQSLAENIAPIQQLLKANL